MMSTKIVKRIYLGLMLLVVAMIVTGNAFGVGIDIKGLRVDYVRDIAIDNVGMLTCGVLLLGIFAGKSEEKQNHAMFRMIFSLVILFFVDLVSSFTEYDSQYVFIILLINTVGYVFEDVLVYTYWTYIRAELDLKSKIYGVLNKIVRIFIAINILLDILNMKLGFFFTVSNSGKFIDSPYQFLSDIPIIGTLLLAVIMIIHKSNIKINEKLILMSFESFPLGAIIYGDISQDYAWVHQAYLLSILLIYIRIFSEREKKIAEQQVELTKQSTALMISQIQPHFLYNVLTTISNLCVTDPEEAEETTVLFSQYLRTNLDSLRNQEPVPFSTELMHIKTYVELEKKRFGDILNVEYDINEQNFKVPSLGIQPIVENSIKHGIRGKNSPGHIKIGTYKVDNGYKIIIEDDGVGFDMNMPPKEDGRSHVGMNNVRARLEQMCNASMKVESSPGNGCLSEIIIPE